MKISTITTASLFAFLFLSIFTFSCQHPCDDLPDSYIKDEADFLPYQFNQQMVFEDSLGNTGTAVITFFNKYPVTEDLIDCTINTEYIESKIKMPELNSSAAFIEIIFNVKKQTDIEVGNDMKLLNYVPSDNAEYYYAGTFNVLGKSFSTVLGLKCKDDTCGTILELVFAKGKGLVAYRTLSGWKALVE